MTAATLPESLVAFEERPSRHTTPAAIASLLGHGVPARLVERMTGVPSIRERLDRALFERLGKLPEELTPAQAFIALLDEAGLTLLTLRAGAVWHAAAIASVHQGDAVRALVERIGPEFREAALADLAAHPRPAAPQADVALPLDGIATAIARDGTACLIAWCEIQPRSIGWRILLRLRLSCRPGPEHLERGPAILERLAAPGDAARR